MDIRLNWLKAKHFKGIKDFALALSGKNANVYGDNGTGKTTQFDEFLWLLFGKNSEDKTAFKVKPQDAEGNDIHMLQTEVEAELAIDGNPLKLKKMQEEKWTRKRGSESTELTGNTISYWVDEVPVKEGEYKAKIGSIVDETVFRMITNPMFFNTKLKWEDRRKIILEICGDVSEEEVLNSTPKLARLKEALSGKSIDDFKKIINERLKALKKDRSDIPPRIDELMMSIPLDQPDYTEIEKALEEYKTIMTGIELEMTDASNIANGFRKKQQELYGLKGKLEQVKARLDSEANKGKKDSYSEQLKLESEIHMIEADIQGFKNRINQCNQTINNNGNERSKLLSEWKDLSSKRKDALAIEFIEPQEDAFICPTCKQALPTEDKNSKLLEMLTNFETEKKRTLERIDCQILKNNEAGLAVKNSTEQAQATQIELTEKLEASETQLKQLEEQLKVVGNEISKPTVEIIYSNDNEYAALEGQIKTFQAELDKPVEDTTAALLQNKREIQDKIDACNKTLNSKDDRAKILKRVEELKEEEKKISAQISELEGHEYLMGQFEVAKVNLIEGSINSRFKFVNFKMFNLLINGGIETCCEAMVNTNGSFVPFSEANHAGKINAGIDCINTLCTYYGVTAPIWIDGRESVVEIINSPSQIISLVVSETDKSLRTEVEA